ncbi:MAG: long-chain fatty acid--CoA ligase [Candidatus Neomarinimicrobiota bacterium]
MITPKHLIDNAEKYSDKIALSYKNSSDEWISQTWSEFYNSVQSISKSLIASGIEKNDKVSIYSYNRREWVECYAAVQLINSAAVGVYHTCSSSEVEWIVNNSDSKIIFVGNNPGDNGEKDKMPVHRLNHILDKLSAVETVVLLDGIEKIDGDKIITWEEFIDKGKSIELDNVMSRMETINDDDTASIIYTSGTTGNPKGVELTYKNFEFELDCLISFLKYEQGDKFISWLPGAHVFGQALDNHYWIRTAMHMYIADNPLNTVDIAKELQPRLFISVPRIYEKVFSNLKSAIESKAILKIGLKIPGLKNVFKKKLQAAAGFGNLKFAISGAAPINPEILSFFQSLDIPLYEGWGLTETTAGATLNYWNENNRIGSVGKVFPNTDIKVAEDGELLLRGANIMKGYYKNPEATSQDIVNGWFHTGDVGKVDDDGFVFITGRKKEIYVSSSGKNIAPLVIEETMKSIPLVSQCFLVGDRRKYCSALFTLDVSVILRDKINVDIAKIPKDPAQQIKMLEEHSYSLSDFTDNNEVFSEIEKEVNKLNNEFSNPEQIKKFSILPRDFTIDEGELTPTLKIRRKQINENWASEIESMYSE